MNEVWILMEQAALQTAWDAAHPTYSYVKIFDIAQDQTFMETAANYE